MNRCSKSGIHEHSPNSHKHIQIFRWIVRWFSIDLPDHGEDGFQIVRCAPRYVQSHVASVFFWLSWSTEELAPCGQGFSQALLFWATSSTLWQVFQPQDYLSLLNFLLLDATGLTAALPSTRQGMHPWVALETWTLRRMSLVQHSSCYRVSPQTFRCNRTRCGGGTCRNKNKKTYSSLLVTTWTQLFLLPFDFESSSSMWSSLSSWNSWYSKFHSSRVKFPLVNVSAIWC